MLEKSPQIPTKTIGPWPSLGKIPFSGDRHLSICRNSQESPRNIWWRPVGAYTTLKRIEATETITIIMTNSNIISVQPESHLTLQSGSMPNNSWQLRNCSSSGCLSASFVFVWFGEIRCNNSPLDDWSNQTILDWFLGRAIDTSNRSQPARRKMWFCAEIGTKFFATYFCQQNKVHQ